jgi:DNA repair protein RadC
MSIQTSSSAGSLDAAVAAEQAAEPWPSTSKPQCRETLFAMGPASLSTTDLLMVLLGTGTQKLSVRQLAMELLAEADLESNCFRDPERLRAIAGIGQAKAARILAAFELGRRACLSRLELKHVHIRSLHDVTAWALPRLSALEHEELWLLCLDAANCLKAHFQVAKGGALGCSLMPADILRPAVRYGASALILVHNHPSGDPTPSADDVNMTRSLARACRLVGITLLDHVVVARGRATSIADRLGTPLDK